MSVDNVCQCRTLPTQRRSIEDSILRNPACYPNTATTPSHPFSKFDPRLNLPLAVPPPPQHSTLKLPLKAPPEVHNASNNINRQSTSNISSLKEKIKQTFSKNKKSSVFSNFHSTSKLSSTPLTPIYKSISTNLCPKSCPACNIRPNHDDHNNNNNNTNVVCNNFLIHKGGYESKCVRCCRNANCQVSTNPRTSSQFYAPSNNQANCSNPLYYRTIQNTSSREQTKLHQLDQTQIKQQKTSNTDTTIPIKPFSLPSGNSSQSVFTPTKRTSTITPPTSHSFDNITPTFLRMKSFKKSRGTTMTSGTKKRKKRKKKTIRILLSLLISQIIGCILLPWFQFALLYPPTVSLSITVAISMAVAFALVTSKLARCSAAIHLCSCASPRGQVGMILFLTGLLAAGPIRNIYSNMLSLSKAFSCYQKQSHEYILSMMNPYDVMLDQLNNTINTLNRASGLLERQFLPLEHNLIQIQKDNSNAKLQLNGASKTCRQIIDSTHRACALHIDRSRDQCDEVIIALGTVYSHARSVLDKINPEKWNNNPNNNAINHNYNPNNNPSNNLNNNPNNVKHIYNDINGPFDSRNEAIEEDYEMDEVIFDDKLRQKRQVLDEDSSFVESFDPNNADKDVCDSLDSELLCAPLGNSDSLCRPYNWAVEDVMETINNTHHIIAQLKKELRVKVNIKRYMKDRGLSASGYASNQITNVNATNSSAIYNEQKRKGEFSRIELLKGGEKWMKWVVGVLQFNIPAGIILTIYVCIGYIKNYTTVVTFDNFYINHQLQLLDKLKGSRKNNNYNETNASDTVSVNICRNGGCRNSKDNTSTGVRNDGWDNSTLCSHRLLPLKNYEKLFIVDATRWRLSVREVGMAKSGMCSQLLLITLTFLLYGIDFLLYIILLTCSRNIDAIYEESGGNSFQGVVEGDGILAQLINVFLRHFHPTKWFQDVGEMEKKHLKLFNSTNETDVTQMIFLKEDSRALCQSPLFPISISLLISIVCFEFFLFIVIFSKARWFRLRNSLVGYFYKDVQEIRLAYLHDALSKQRSNLQAILHKVVRTNHDKHHSFYKPVIASLAPQTACLISKHNNSSRYRQEQNRIMKCLLTMFSKIKLTILVRKFRCYVCNQKQRDHVVCATDECCGSYCQGCYEDLNRICPLCYHPHDDQQSVSTKVYD